MGLTVNVSAARKRLATVVAGLRAAASGEVLARAAAKVEQQIAAVSRRVLGNHVLTGNAQSTAITTHAGGLVQLTAPAYLHFHAWWMFRSGMPPFVVASALKIFEAELVAALGGKPSPLALAEAAAEEAAAEKSRAKFRRDVAKIYRQSAEGKANRALERAHQRRIKAHEDRE